MLLLGVNVLQAILDAVNGLVQPVLQVAKHACVWFWQQTWTLLSIAMGGVESWYADMFGQFVAIVTDNPIVGPALVAVEWANKWVALDVGFTLLALYWAFRAGVVPVQFIIRHLPVVGGG